MQCFDDMDYAKCYDRKCKYFRGIKWLDEGEETEVNYCDAFPEGIPQEIAFGDNLHLEPYAGDHGIQYAKK